MSVYPTSNEITTLHAVLHWAIEHWQFSLFLLGSAIGTIVWWLHITFASKELMEVCRLDMIENYDKKMERYHTENKEEHRVLRTDVKLILAHLLDKNTD